MKKKLFKKVLKIYALILSILSVFLLFYVYNSLISYEKSIPDNFIKEKLYDGTIAGYFKDDFETSKYDNGKLDSKTLTNYYKNEKIDIKMISEDKDGLLYGIYNNDVLVTNVLLRKVGESIKLGILKANELEINEVDFKFDNGLYFYEILIPNSYKLFVNKKEVKEFENKSLSELERVSLYDKEVSSKYIKLYNLINKPVIKITDSKDKEINYEVKDNKITIENKTEKVTYENLKLKDKVDVLNIAKDWSLLLTDDLGGVNHGFNKIEGYFIKDSYMYKLAHDWAFSRTINDTSSHTAPVFNDESVGDCVVYSENSFSCVVKLSKTFKLTKSGGSRTDKMNEKLFFTYYEGKYKLVDMQSIEK